MSKVLEVSNADFHSQVLASDVPVLVDFWAESCAPCKMISPILDELAEEVEAGTLKIVKVNVESSQSTAMSYGIRGLPTLMMFDGGDYVGQHVGTASKRDIVDLINQV